MKTLNFPGSREQAKLVLAVDDDADILAVIRAALEREGLEVRTASSGVEALEKIRQQGLPHLLIVDLLMPGLDGIAVCSAVKEFSDVPIIILTAVDTKETRVDLIERFAEDYIVKPFEPRELTVRVLRLLRRINDFSYALEPVIRVDERLAVDLAGQRAIVEGQPVNLTPTESKLLYLLMQGASRPINTAYLLNRLWPGSEVFEDTLRVHIHRLRQKIEPADGERRYIVTERGSGYAFRPQPQH